MTVLAPQCGLHLSCHTSLSVVGRVNLVTTICRAWLSALAHMRMWQGTEGESALPFDFPFDLVDEVALHIPLR